MITFDGDERLVTLSLGTVELDVHNLYSEWKIWVKTSENAKYAQAFAIVGGDDIDPVSGTVVPLYAFLLNGWRLKPQEASHTLAVTAGILLVDGGGDPFVDTTGSFIVRINYQQPVQAIKVESGTSGLTPTESAQLAVIDSVSTRIPAALSGGKMDSTLSSSERDAVAVALLDLAAGVEAGLTMRQALRIAVGLLAGKSDGWPSGTKHYRDTNDTKNRVTATVDADGNRTAVTLDAS